MRQHRSRQQTASLNKFTDMEALVYPWPTSPHQSRCAERTLMHGCTYHRKRGLPLQGHRRRKLPCPCAASATSLWQGNCHENLGILSSISGLHSYSPDPRICDSPNCLQTLSDAYKMFRKLLEAFNKTNIRTLILECLPWLILQD